MRAGGDPPTSHCLASVEKKKMSKSNSKINSLAQSYALLFGKKKKIEESMVYDRPASVATVEAKLKAAESSDAINVEYTGPGQRRDVVTGQGSQGAAATASTDIHDGELPAAEESSDKGPEGIRIDKQARLKMARSLTNPELMWSKFFSGMLDDCIDAVEENLRDSKAELVSSVEEDLGRMKMDHRAANVCSLPIKLILTPLRRGRTLVKAFASRLEMQFGPLHAALRVGQVILEWNDGHLVTPYLCGLEDRLIQVNLEKHSRWVDSVKQHRGQLEQATDDLNHTGQMEQVFLIAARKKEMIDALIEVIVTYNTSYYYNLINRNCQHFVMDALNALGVKMPKEFTGGLRDYYKAVIKGRDPDIPSKFTTHRDLDKYVEEEDLSSMTQPDLEYILAMYFRFHIESKEKVRHDTRLLEEWECEEKLCRVNTVEKLVDYDNLLIHKFQPMQ